MSLPTYTVWFRGFPACPCLAEWLPPFEAELLRRGVIRESIDIAQLIGGAEASGGTHTKGGAGDIWQHDPVTVYVARQMGADAAWARTTGSFANNRHTHFVLTGCPHNGPAWYQIAEVRAGGDGLIGSTPDPGPRPLSGRTWRQGIAWAAAQATTAEEEQLMAAADDIIAAIREEGQKTREAADARLDQFARGEVARDRAGFKRVQQLIRDGRAAKRADRDILAAVAEVADQGADDTDSGA